MGFLGSDDDTAEEEEEAAAMPVVEGDVVVGGRRKARAGVGAWSKTDDRRSRAVIRIMVMAGRLQALALAFLLVPVFVGWVAGLCGVCVCKWRGLKVLAGLGRLDARTSSSRRQPGPRAKIPRSVKARHSRHVHTMSIHRGPAGQ